MPEPDSVYENTDSDEEPWEVEKLTKRRVRLGQVQYLVKWKGYNNRHNVWRSIDELDCDELITEFESSHAEVAIGVVTETQIANMAESQAVELFGENDSRDREAVSQLLAKQN